LATGDQLEIVNNLDKPKELNTTVTESDISMVDKEEHNLMQKFKALFTGNTKFDYMRRPNQYSCELK